jgi:hypothetical protein
VTSIFLSRNPRLTAAIPIPPSGAFFPHFPGRNARECPDSGLE